MSETFPWKEWSFYGKGVAELRQSARELFDDCMENDSMEKMKNWLDTESSSLALAQGISTTKARNILKKKIGYMAGLDGVSALEYVYEWLDAKSPALGTPTEMRALDEMGQYDKNCEYAKEHPELDLPVPVLTLPMLSEKFPCKRCREPIGLMGRKGLCLDCCDHMLPDNNEEIP